MVSNMCSNLAFLLISYLKDLYTAFPWATDSLRHLIIDKNAINKMNYECFITLSLCVSDLSLPRDFTFSHLQIFAIHFIYSFPSCPSLNGPKVA